MTNVVNSIVIIAAAMSAIVVALLSLSLISIFNFAIVITSVISNIFTISVNIIITLLHSE